jgi:hypothetical protein
MEHIDILMPWHKRVNFQEYGKRPYEVLRGNPTITAPVKAQANQEMHSPTSLLDTLAAHGNLVGKHAD